MYQTILYIYFLFTLRQNDTYQKKNFKIGSTFVILLKSYQNNAFLFTKEGHLLSQTIGAIS